MKGKIIFISGPSGAGKGTLIHALKDQHEDWIFPPSFSTREMRPDESQGNPYNFISHEEFKKKIDNDEFLEYAEVHGQDQYGTDRETLLKPAEEGKIVVKEFDVQGYKQVMEKLPKEIYTSIFIKASGGTGELIRRIKGRSDMSEKELIHRMESMKKELEMEKYYDYSVFNDELPRAVMDTSRIILEECGL